MRPHPRYAETDPSAPRAWATCERTGFVTNAYRLQWQYEWRGTSLERTGHLIAEPYLDKPQRQLGAVILAPDPVGIMNARPENYTMDEQTFRVTETGIQRYQMNGIARIQSNVQSGSPASGP
jgi:hypothetical protein